MKFVSLVVNSSADSEREADVEVLSEEGGEVEGERGEGGKGEGETGVEGESSEMSEGVTSVASETICETEGESEKAINSETSKKVIQRRLTYSVSPEPHTRLSAPRKSVPLPSSPPPDDVVVATPTSGSRKRRRTHSVSPTSSLLLQSGTISLDTAVAVSTSEKGERFVLTVFVSCWCDVVFC